MIWAYVGGGDWELQGGMFVGCIYGNKFDDKVKLTIELVVDRKEVKRLWETPVQEMPLEDAKRTIIDQLKKIHQGELDRLNGPIY